MNKYKLLPDTMRQAIGRQAKDRYMPYKIAAYGTAAVGGALIALGMSFHVIDGNKHTLDYQTRQMDVRDDDNVAAAGGILAGADVLVFSIIKTAEAVQKRKAAAYYIAALTSQQIEQLK